MRAYQQVPVGDDFDLAPGFDIDKGQPAAG